MAKIVRGRQYTDEEVENLESGAWDDELVMVRCVEDGWEKVGLMKDLRHDFDVDFYDREQKFFRVYTKREGE